MMMLGLMLHLVRVQAFNRRIYHVGNCHENRVAVCLSVCLTVCLSVCVTVCLAIITQYECHLATILGLFPDDSPTPEEDRLWSKWRNHFADRMDLALDGTSW